jgi:ArsR family transcriptional regulator
MKTQALRAAKKWKASEIALAQAAKALAHPARLSILRHLCERATCQCGELVGLLPIAQATVSQHLAVLRRAGLIQGAISGPAVCYCIQPAALKKVSTLLQSFLEETHRGAARVETCACENHETNP